MSDSAWILHYRNLFVSKDTELMNKIGKKPEKTLNSYFNTLCVYFSLFCVYLSKETDRFLRAGVI